MTRPDFKRILIVATRQIGDVLCTTPLMHRTRELWPHAVIDVLGYEKTMGMLVGNPDIDAVIESPEHPKWPEYKQLIRRIFRKYDLSIVTQPSDRAHIYGLLAASRRVGIIPSAQTHNWWKRLLSLHSVEVDYWAHHVVIERLRLLDPFLGPVSIASPKLSVSVTPPASKALPNELASFVDAGRVIVVHATPMWRFKRWPVESWVNLVSHLLKDGGRVVLTGSSSAQDRSLNLEIQRAIQSKLGQTSEDQLRNCAGLLSLGQMTTLLSSAELYLGVDTSITHLSAACGTPTIALFGPTSVPNFGPWPKDSRLERGTHSIWRLTGYTHGESIRIQQLGNVRIVQGPGDCVPCRKAGCDNHFDSKSRCLNDLAWTDVMQLIGDFRR